MGARGWACSKIVSRVMRSIAVLVGGGSIAAVSVGAFDPVRERGRLEWSTTFGRRSCGMTDPIARAEGW